MTNQDPKNTNAMKEAKDRRSFERFQSIYLSLKVYTQREIARYHGALCENHPLYVSAYKEKGLYGLEITYSPGADGRRFNILFNHCVTSTRLSI
jgi:hypothetical protein